MKRVITALGTPKVNEKLRKFPELEIIMSDIQYQEGILEALEINNKIDVIILSELLPGKLEIKELVEKIKKINNTLKLIIILENKKEDIENYLLSKGKINIFYNNQIKIEEIVTLIINKKENEELEKEIKQLKQIIKNKEENNTYQITENEISQQEIKEIEEEIENEYNNKIIKYNFIKKIKNKDRNKEAKIVTVSGLSGIGKSIFTVNLAKILKEYKKQILIIDFDIFNKSVSTLFNKTKKKTKKQSMVCEEENVYQVGNTQKEKIIQRITSKIDLIQGMDLICENQNRLEEIQLIKKIKELKNKYDLIMIDTSTECFYDFTKIIMRSSEKIIFISEANFLQIKKSQKILDIYINEWKINQQSINLIFNKNKEDSIDFNILKEIFKDFNIIGKIDFIKQYNTLINQSMNTLFIEKNIKKEYWKIGKEILKNSKTKMYYLNKIEGENDDRNGFNKE